MISTNFFPIIGIYKITSPSNRVYIGQSTNIIKRWKTYKKIYCKKQIKLYNSLTRYTPENHSFEIIEECTTEQLNERETYWKQYYIDQLGWDKVLFCELYDNSTGPRSEEIKQKISKKLTGRKLSEKWKQKISSNSIGKKITWGDKISKNKKGVIYSNERNIKIGEKNKGISKNNKAVLQYDLKGNFIKKHTSQTEAARNININHSSGIQACCCGLQKTAHKYKWSYEKEKINRDREKN